MSECTDKDDGLSERCYFYDYNLAHQFDFLLNVAEFNYGAITEDGIIH